MTSYLGLSTATRRRLEQEAKEITGTLHVTVHKAAHLKNNSLVDSRSNPYCSLQCGSQRFLTRTYTLGGGGGGRGGAIHPEWEQTFTFQLPGSTTGTRPASALLSSTRPSSAFPSSSSSAEWDGCLHLYVWDGSILGAVSPQQDGSGCLGRLDLNLAMLFQDADGAGAQVHRWHELRDARRIENQAGFVCLSVRLEGGKGQGMSATASTLSVDGAPARPLSAFDPPLASLLSTTRPGTAVTPTRSSGTPTPAHLTTFTSPPPPSDLRPHELWPAPSPTPVAPGYPVNQHSPVATNKKQGGGNSAQVVPMSMAISSPSRTKSASPSHAQATAEAPYSDEDPSSSTSASLDLITSYDQRHPHHVLQFLSQLPLGRRFICSGCHQEGFRDLYHCTEGCTSFDLHESCLRPLSAEEVAKKEVVDMRLDPRHPHPFTWVQIVPNQKEEGSYRCKGCGGGGAGAAWHCKACGDSLHPACMR